MTTNNSVDVIDETAMYRGSCFTIVNACISEDKDDRFSLAVIFDEKPSWYIAFTDIFLDRGKVAAEYSVIQFSESYDSCVEINEDIIQTDQFGRTLSEKLYMIIKELFYNDNI